VHVKVKVILGTPFVVILFNKASSTVRYNVLEEFHVVHRCVDGNRTIRRQINWRSVKLRSGHAA